MKIAGFEFAEGARFQSGAPTDAKLVGEHIELLREKFKGELTPQDVLDDAKNDNSPLHGFFEWTDSKAAQAYRLQQARGLIRAVVAIYTSDDKPAVRQKVYIHIAEAKTPHYREITHAMSQKKTRDMVLQRAWRELQAWRKRYGDLAQFAALIKVIDKTGKELPKDVAEV